MLPSNHAFASASGLYCDTCQLPESNRVHLPSHLAATSDLVTQRCAEFQMAKDAMVTAMHHLGRLTTRAEHPTAQFVGFNVSEQYDSGHTFTTVNVEGIYTKDGTALDYAKFDDLDSLFEWSYIVMVEGYGCEPDDHVTYYLDLDTTEVDTTGPRHHTEVDTTLPTVVVTED